MSSTVRRAAVVAGLAAGLVAATVAPAAAQFSASTSLQTSVTTATVAAPGNVQAARTICTNNQYFSLYTGTISWTPSDARDVTGYTVRRHLPNGSSEVVARPDADATWALHLGGGGGTTYVYSVTTETAYGWTAQSGRTAPITC